MYQTANGGSTWHPVFIGFNALYGTSVGLQATNDNNVIVGYQNLKVRQIGGAALFRFE